MPSGLPSASTILTTIKGISLPSSAKEILDFATGHGAPEEVQMILERLPEGDYESASDIAKGVAVAGREIKDLVPNTSASDVAKMIAGVDFPASKDEIVEVAKKNGASEDVIKIMENMTRDTFRNVVDIGRGIREAKDNIRRNSRKQAMDEFHQHQGTEEVETEPEVESKKEEKGRKKVTNNG